MSSDRHAVRTIAGAALLGRPGEWDITLHDGLIESVQPSDGVRGTGVPRRDGNLVVHAAGRMVLPGLHDHHLHLLALAALERSVRCDPASCPDESTFARVLRSAEAGSDGTIRGFGYHESTAGDLTRRVLDDIRSDAPIRIQHRSGSAWFHNSASLRRIGSADHPDGRLFRGTAAADSTEIGKDAVHIAPTDLQALRQVSDRLASYGVTTVTDATPFRTGNGLSSLLRAGDTGSVLQHLHVMGAPDAPTPTGRTNRVAAKIVLDEAHTPSFEHVCAQINKARAMNLPVAIHLTDRSTTWLALAAWSELGVRHGDRIEHGAVLDTDALTRISDLGLRVVTNPALAAERAADHQNATADDDREHLWRCGSLIDADIPVAGGTDAPYAAEDPWASIRAAVDRGRAPNRAGTDRDLLPMEGISLFTDPRSLAVGQPADLVITATSQADLVTDLSPTVIGTVIAGRQVWP